MRELEVALRGDVIDREMLQRTGADVGEIEAQMTWAQAMAMLTVRGALSAEQLDALLTMRAKYTVSETSVLHRGGVDRGRQLFAQCVLCHTPSRANAVAPSLSNILGRDIASDTGFENYSPALRRFAQAEGNWNDALLDAFLKSPRGLVPGTTMGFDGFASEQDRAALIGYLATLD